MEGREKTWRGGGDLFGAIISITFDGVMQTLPSNRQCLQNTQTTATTKGTKTRNYDNAMSSARQKCVLSPLLYIMWVDMIID